MGDRHRPLALLAVAAASYLLGALTLGPALAVSTTVHLAPGDQVTVIADLPTPTPTPVPTPTPTPVPTPTATPVPTPTPTPFPTPTPTPVPTPTATPTGCTTTLAAGANIYSALSAASAGAVICLHGGAYSYSGINTVTKQGTAAAPITVQAYPGETPVISDSGGPNAEAIFMYFSGAAYLNVKGLTVNGMPGVQGDGNGSAIFDFVGGSHHITLDGNTLNGSSAWNSSQHAVYIAYDSHDLTVSNNVIDGNGALGAGVHMYHQPPTGTNITVQGNTIREWDQCILDWLDDNNVLIKANTFSTCRIAMRYGANGTTTLDSNIIGTGVTTRLYVDSGSTGLTQVGQSW